MKNNTSKVVNLVLAMLSLLSFLFLDMVKPYENIGITGADLVELGTKYKQSLPLWVWLSVLLPLVVAAVRYAMRRKVWMVLNAALMLLPFVMMLSKADTHSQLGPGAYVCLLLGIGMVLVALFTEDGVGAEPAVGATAPAAAAAGPAALPDVRHQYTDQQLREVLASPQLYRPELVDLCARELKIRYDAGQLMPTVQAYSDREIAAVLGNPQTYAEAMVYCCQLEHAQRQGRLQQAAAERQRQEQAAAMAQQQRMAQARQERRRQLWLKCRWWLAAAAVVAVVVGVVLYMMSSGRHYRKGLGAFQEQNYASAISHMESVGQGYEKYSDACYVLYQAYLSTGDTAQAAAALQHATQGINWDVHPEACQAMACHWVHGDLRPYIEPDAVAAATLMETAYDEPAVRVAAAELYFANQKYVECYNICSAYESSRERDWTALTAKGYAALCHLFGVGGASKDVPTARRLLQDVPSRTPFADYKVLCELALTTEDNASSAITRMAQALEGYRGPILSDGAMTAVSLAESFCEAREAHADESYFNRGDQRWDSYTFRSGDGRYEGEYLAKGYATGGANGWGIFRTRETSQEQGRYYHVELGKFRLQGNRCPLYGTGLLVDYYPSQATFYVTYGEFDNGNTVSARSWSNTASHLPELESANVELPF